MTTLGDAIVSALDTNWNVGTGGAEPNYYSEEDYTNLHAAIADTDYIVMLGSTYSRQTRRLNDEYVAHTDTIEFIVSTQSHTDMESRLDELVAEVRRLITPTNVTGYHRVDIISEDRNVSKEKIYRALLRVEAKVYLTDSAVTPGSVTTATLTVDELTVNTSVDIGSSTISGTTSSLTLSSVMGAVLWDVASTFANEHISANDASDFDFTMTNRGAGDLIVFPDKLKIGAATITVDDILDEDDMASNSATALATQQSIKAYIDAIESALDARITVLEGP